MAWSGLNYNAPNTTPSGIDANGTHNGVTVPNSEQFRTFKYLKKALITARKEQYFMPLASVENMPKHMGKTIKVYEYIPLLDDRNINDQGIFADGVTTGNGNLYGSSKDIGYIEGRLPHLTEEGGRKNRVGFSRIVREGSIQKFGFFTEFTQEALDFDTDEQLMDHISRELMNGAVQITEAQLQKDLLAGAGVKYFTGASANLNQVSGEGGDGVAAVVTYEDFSRLDQTLTDNRTPKKTKVITGSRYIDTKVIPASRVAYVGSEVVPLLKTMTDPFGNKAFIEVQHYADAGNILNGEIGSIDSFRIIQVPEMLHWAGGAQSDGTGLTGGAKVVDDDEGYRTSIGLDTESYFNVYPILVVGDDSFTTIGFQTDGKSVKFSVLTKMPGRETADYNDPYGETGFSSIKWYYGSLIKRPERIAVMHTVAPI